MVAVPPDTPVSKPDEEPIVEITVLLLLHVPPVTASLKVVVKPAHTLDAPEIAIGEGLTVTVVVVVQPVGNT